MKRRSLAILCVSATAAVIPAVIVSGCGGDSDAAESDRTVTEAHDPLLSPTVDGLYEVADDGRRLYLMCWGEGSPTVVLEAGHPDGTGIADFGFTEFARRLAAETRVCAYDRAGWGRSDPAPDEPRSADDAVDDLEALLKSAEIDGPLVLAGSSFGGMIVTHFADRHPDDVTGVVLLDVPAPSATLSAKEIPEIAWNHPANPEHLDIGPEFENRFARVPPSFSAPLVVVTATGGASTAEDQRTWLESSPDARQITLDGGHEIYLDAPVGAADEVLRLARQS